MRGSNAMQEAPLSVSRLDDFVSPDRSLPSTQRLVNESPSRVNGLFNTIYADTGRASIAPEKLMRALLLRVFCSMSSERQLVDQIRSNLLFCGFMRPAMDYVIWDCSVFSKSADRLLKHEVVESFFIEVTALADTAGLPSNEYFSVDGTLIGAWASHKCSKPKDGSDGQGPSGPGRNAQANWKGTRRRNHTHATTTDTDARKYRQSQNAAATLTDQGHVSMEDHFELVVERWSRTPTDSVSESRRSRCSMPSLRARPVRSAWTRRTTCTTSSRRTGADASRRVWPPIIQVRGQAPLTHERRATRDPGSARSGVGASRSTSAGARCWGASAKPSPEAPGVLISTSS